MGVVQVMVDGVVRDATAEEAAEIAAREDHSAVLAVPQQVTRRQARQALLLAGLLDQVAPAIAAIPDTVQRGMALIEWEDSQTFERNRPVLIQLAGAIGLGAAELDQLFITAAGL